ncbi:MAG: DeoR/GlpR transcriptional regulator [Clostridia bacterium]|nr:DeoR/GlpR transcriptional regulator [Clostridia bacterium]
MFKDQRKEKIIELLQEREYISVETLCRLLYASAPTVRRDLTLLEKEGFLKRSHGGAMLIRSDSYRPLAFRAGSMLQEKRRIAKGAAALIPDGAVIFIDGSTTAAAIIAHLREKQGITVITNGLNAMNLLQEYKISAKCTGGDLLPGSGCFAGRMAERFVESVNADWLFFSTSSVTGAITDYSEPETYLRQTMLRQAAKKVFLFDHTKWGKTATFNVAALGEMDYIVSDLPAPKGLEEKWITAGSRSEANGGNSLHGRR